MSADRVLDEAGLRYRLQLMDCVETEHRSQTGTIWRTPAGKHFNVPRPYQGFYPDWMLWDIEQVIQRRLK